MLPNNLLIPVSSASFVITDHDTDQWGQSGGREGKNSNRINISTHKSKHHKFTNNANELSSSSGEDINLYDDFDNIK